MLSQSSKDLNSGQCNEYLHFFFIIVRGLTALSVSTSIFSIEFGLEFISVMIKVSYRLEVCNVEELQGKHLRGLGNEEVK